MKRCWILILILSLLSCGNFREKESYEIYNTVLREKVSTYGIILNYIHFPNNFTMEQIDSISIRKSDSLRKSKSLKYFLDDTLTILDTLNPSDEFFSGKGDNLEVKFKPTYSKNKIDFSKIQDLGFAKRLDKESPIDENQKNPTYLGSYDLSEPIFISQDKAVIRYQHYCGGTCGLGILIYLKKENGQWKIINEKGIWIS